MLLNTYVELTIPSQLIWASSLL